MQSPSRRNVCHVGIDDLFRGQSNSEIVLGSRQNQIPLIELFLVFHLSRLGWNRHRGGVFDIHKSRKGHPSISLIPGKDRFGIFVLVQILFDFLAVLRRDSQSCRERRGFRQSRQRPPDVVGSTNPADHGRGFYPRRRRPVEGLYHASVDPLWARGSHTAVVDLQDADSRLDFAKGCIVGRLLVFPSTVAHLRQQDLNRLFRMNRLLQIRIVESVATAAAGFVCCCLFVQFRFLGHQATEVEASWSFGHVYYCV
mmetsp:Transcript_4851/g.11581  ORF Transcript_4851/g.11581 Transcript_4851/m.11581 type:complete len:254 (+) Transcript_4851:1985-2746(+)